MKPKWFFFNSADEICPYCQKTGGERMTISLRWDHGTTGLRGQSVNLRCRTLTRQRGHTWKLAGCTSVPKMSFVWVMISVQEWMLQGGEKNSVVLFWDSTAHFRATQGFYSSGILCGSPVVFSFSPSSGKSKPKSEGGCAAKLGPVTRLKKCGTFSQESSSTLSLKALSVSNLKEDRGRNEGGGVGKCYSEREMVW